MKPRDVPAGILGSVPAEPAAPAPIERRCRTIWLSDIHLGTAGCKAEYLLDFLRHHDCETLYLVGDIVDGWQLRKGWFWPRTHNDVIQKLLRKARKGTRVVFVPGNHDEFARQFVGLAFGDIEVVNEAIHLTADGRRLWVVHGDQFDAVIQRARWLAFVGDSLYTFTLVLNHWFNRLRSRLGLCYWSLSQYLKHKVKNAVSFISDFESALAGEARRRGYDGVVCGHIHKAEIRDIGGVLYCNDGDWVESLSALIETPEGGLELVFWGQIRAGRAGVQQADTAAEAPTAAPVPATAISSVALPAAMLKGGLAETGATRTAPGDEGRPTWT